MKYSIVWMICEGLEYKEPMTWDSRDMAQLAGVLQRGPMDGPHVGRAVVRFRVEPSQTTLTLSEKRKSA